MLWTSHVNVFYKQVCGGRVLMDKLFYSCVIMTVCEHVIVDKDLV